MSIPEDPEFRVGSPPIAAGNGGRGSILRAGFMKSRIGKTPHSNRKAAGLYSIQ